MLYRLFGIDQGIESYLLLTGNQAVVNKVMDFLKQANFTPTYDYFWHVF